MLTFKRLSGAALAGYLPELAQLRIRVFRDWPYLYDGDLAYEERYLQTYIQAPDSVIVLAFNGDSVVGASTGIPLKHETADVKQPFIDAGFDIDSVFYCGESVLLSAYRGQGAGVEFFDQREAHAREIGGFAYSCFCGVQRPDNHPSRPADYVPLAALQADIPVRTMQAPDRVVRVYINAPFRRQDGVVAVHMQNFANDDMA